MPSISIPEYVLELTDNMIKILHLFDKIVKEEFVDFEEIGGLEMSNQIQYQGEGSEGFSGLTCDYCGADIFQSFFECSSCGDSDPVHICVGCSVEGRTCKCGKANPRQRCGSDVLFKIQSEAVEAVRPFIVSEVKPVKLGLRFALRSFP